jgi:hypothetical protein
MPLVMKGAAAQLHLAYPRPPCDHWASECGQAGRVRTPKHPRPAGRAGTAARLAPSNLCVPRAVTSWPPVSKQKGRPVLPRADTAPAAYLGVVVVNGVKGAA